MTEEPLWNCLPMKFTGPYRWVNFGLSDGFVPSGNIPLPESMLSQVIRHMASLIHNGVEENAFILELSFNVVLVSIWNPMWHVVRRRCWVLLSWLPIIWPFICGASGVPLVPYWKCIIVNRVNGLWMRLVLIDWNLSCTQQTLSFI